MRGLQRLIVRYCGLSLIDIGHYLNSCPFGGYHPLFTVTAKKRKRKNFLKNIERNQLRTIDTLHIFQKLFYFLNFKLLKNEERIFH